MFTYQEKYKKIFLVVETGLQKISGGNENISFQMWLRKLKKNVPL